MAKGRFDEPPNQVWKTLLAGMWDGIRLRCPSCGSEGIFVKGYTPREQCPNCNAPFERPGEGDFWMTMVLVYGFASIVIVILIFLLNSYTELDVATQIWITLPVGILFVFAFYRNLKGVWITILIALVKWWK